MVTVVTTAARQWHEVGFYRSDEGEAPSRGYIRFFFERGHPIALPRVTTLDKPRQRLLAIGADVLISRLDELQQSVVSRPTMQQRLDVIEQAVGRLPLSIRAWYTIVGSVNFVGYSDAWLKLLPDDPDDVCSMYRLDPLVISPLEASIQVYPLSTATQLQETKPKPPLMPTWSRFNQYDPAPVEPQWLNWKSNASGVKYRLELAKSPRGKYNAGPDDIGIEAELPQSGVDLDLVAASQPIGLSFVNYLRTCFQWGGFPGWEQYQTRPDKELTYLTNGVEAI